MDIVSLKKDLNQTMVYILTNKKLALELRQDTKYNFDIINLNEFDIPELWKNVHQSRLNTKVILKTRI